MNAARADIADYFKWYSANRLHSSLDKLTPGEKYFAGLTNLKRAT